MRLCVVGTGYVGLVSAACFSEMGNTVRCVDVNEAVVESLRLGRLHIFEPGLDILVQRNARDGRLSFTSDPAEGLDGAEVAFLCVGTPARDDGSCDLRWVMRAAADIGRNMQTPMIIVDKSTVPVGTADAVHAAVAGEQKKRGVDIPFDVVSNPEFMKEGDAVNDFMKPDRVVVGTDNPESELLMRELYAPFARSREKMIVTGVRSAEMIKYAANCMLASKISFINEMAAICEKVGADVNDVRLGIGADHRIGPHFIYPGLGYGGSCFPKDVRALIHTAREAGIVPQLLEAVDAVNNSRKIHMARKVLDYFNERGGAHGRTLAIWGLAFKANTDDVRESAAVTIIRELARHGMRIRAYDPAAARRAAEQLGDIPGLTLTEDQYEATDGADALLVATEWNMFRTPDFVRVKAALSAPVIFDGRNLYSEKIMARNGFIYYSIGRGRPAK
ncbi:MAG: UDP-glucose/GDP-mannose dehydrogenase family protein [Desulfovibrio sp.]|jgi:UDPglucose 6-dehydrogenase|nr:UDP-glucose/GDP-mannose dehydrogenase family protein [Desulfovibrio sp.]